MVFFRKGNFLYELFAQARHSLEGDQFMGGFMKQELRVGFTVVRVYRCRWGIP
jgi:hypothetical protein